MLQKRNRIVNSQFAIKCLISCSVYDIMIAGVLFVTERGLICIGLAKIRKSKGLSQQRLAVLSGVHRVTIARFETGKISPTLATLNKLAAALGVKISDIAG